MPRDHGSRGCYRVRCRDARTCQKVRSLNEYAFDIWTPMAQYWAGFLFADGTIVRRSGSPELAVVLAEKDVSHVEKLRSFLASDHAITRIGKEQQQGNFGGASGAVRFSVRSERLVDRLEYAGMVANQGRLACVELAHSSDFWRGVVDGDGWVGGADSRGRARLELVGSHGLLSQFAAFVRHHCPLSAVQVSPHKSISRVALCGRDARTILDLLYTDAAVALGRKRNAAINIKTRGDTAFGEPTALAAALNREPHTR